MLLHFLFESSRIDIIIITVLVFAALYLLYLLLHTVRSIVLPVTDDCPFGKNITQYSLLRHDQNPILSPTAGNYWQSQGTFNPSALMDNDGNVHVLYRTVGDDGVSRLGYMMSLDGKTDWQHVHYPVYESDCVEYSRSNNNITNFDPSYYTSGGGWIGCEDPRLTVIDNTVYLTYIAFAGWNSIRIAYTSQSIHDFRAQRWNWKKSHYLSPIGEIHKNWLLFPRKINGKFALLYNIWPRVSIHYCDRLEELEHNAVKIAKSWNRGSYPGMPDSWILIEQGTAGERWVDPSQLDAALTGDENRWDTWMRGAGPTPLETHMGWLVFYHAMDKTDPHRYKLGCLILDRDNPTKVLYKAPVPLLSPDAEYENDYKNGVLFVCGAVIRNGTLLLYYGGGDKHVCVAHTPLSELLEWISQYPVN